VTPDHSITYPPKNLNILNKKHSDTSQFLPSSLQLQGKPPSNSFAELSTKGSSKLDSKASESGTKKRTRGVGDEVGSQGISELWHDRLYVSSPIEVHWGKDWWNAYVIQVLQETCNARCSVNALAKRINHPPQIGFNYHCQWSIDLSHLML
jgi:hypothetical protein